MSETLSLLFELSVFIFVYASMFGLGLNVKVTQILKPLRDARLVAVSLIANFVFSPILAFVIARILGLGDDLATGFFIVSVCAGSPIMAKHVEMAKGDLAFATGLLVLLQVGTIVAAPLLLPLMLAGAENIQVDSLAIVRSLVVNMLLPLVAGLFIYARYDDLAQTLRPYASQASSITLLMQIVLALVLGFGELIGLVGTRAFLASALLIVGSLALGYVLGGAKSEIKKVLAIGTATANISAAMLITVQNFPEPQTIVMVLSFGFVSLIINTLIAAELGKRAGDLAGPAPNATADVPTT